MYSFTNLLIGIFLIVVIFCALAIVFRISHKNIIRILGKKAASRNITGGIIMMGVVCLIFVGFLYIPPITFMDQEIKTIDLLFLILCPILLLVVIIMFIRRSRQVVLLDIGESELDKNFKRAGYLWLILGIIRLIAGIFELPDFDDVLYGIIWMLVGAPMVIQGKGTRIVEKGIIIFGGLFKWEKIESYGWESDKENTLSLKLKRRLPLRKIVSIPVPPDNKEEVDKLMKEKFPEISMKE